MLFLIPRVAHDGGNGRFDRWKSLLLVGIHVRLAFSQLVQDFRFTDERSLADAFAPPAVIYENANPDGNNGSPHKFCNPGRATGDV
jgi:hypothetical protein